MISVEQIRALEERIEKALAYIANLKTENASLKSKTAAAEAARLGAEKRAEAAEFKVLELEEAAETFGRDQQRIEEGIVHALEKLDAFEDLVLRGENAETGSGKGSAAVETRAPAVSTPEPASPRVTAEPAAKAERSAPAAAAGEEATAPAETVASAPATENRNAVDELDIF
jgi:hypothetical protein